MRTIDLKHHGIVVELYERGDKVSDNGGNIRSSLHTKDDSPQMTAAWDAVELVILAHAVTGVDINTPNYRRGIIDAVEAIGNVLTDIGG